ncbi:Lipopolysaccharide biosynthesis regulator YciM, contains six TPR domains and a predicted metal-binding C-terminal domain [Polynucleobacter meluiroseus]|uniref:Lipopolysaccharide assembly protein B n=1 Tax=Polynucleobacter meluiroseus TaxID=1938814 RepID=A0A240DYW1_9BURK|nr:lipopolysaccharide assembly protein LapB [Polynucleobacter meluiroseus]SNX28157.1 Lipopolysaccharide biosynthesis regulator YciM, contains six TPR domains and a predicted metal-binding C-terminal domain [Polynucleobacter meluiroseus]
MIHLATSWLLVLPVLFGLGWLASRWDLRLENRMDELERLRQQRSTFKGLSLLLNEQPDQAIETLVKIAQLDPETIELHFALGNLFRRRGETERAIRVHQHLAERDDLKPRDRNRAAYELGRDFLRAGLLDRAEASLNRVGEGKFAAPAKESLLEMYQVERDWKKAIVAAHELEALQQKSHQTEIAQFYCELGQEALQSNNLAELDAAIKQALVAIPNHARALILQGDYLVALGRPAEAIEAWGIIAQTHPAYMHLLADRWMAAHTALNKADEGLSRLCPLLKTQASGELLDIVQKHMTQIRGPQAAEVMLVEVMQYSPSLSALSKLAETRLALANDHGSAERISDLKATLSLLKQRTTSLARYTCNNCGFRARRFYWQCPGCSHWEAYSPRRSEGAVPSGPSM